MKNKYFSPDGRFLIGKLHRGKHYSKIPSSYLEWAKQELPGFSGELENVRQHKQPERKEGKIYMLNYNLNYKDVISRISQRAKD